MGMKVHSFNTVIVGSGAAGFATADRLVLLGQRDIAMVTENRGAGTSRNTGSDKQTYYKLTLSGGEGDSVREMAETLFRGGCMDGDIALCEAALSARGFLRLCDLGVPFPQNRYGEFIGYKTDHDPRRRATSAGPYTSKFMTEALERSVAEQGVPIYDRHLVIQVLREGQRVKGLLCLDENSDYVLFRCRNIVYATGGPAGLYADSVYPLCQHGASGTAFSAGVRGRNLTEWQYGLASRKPRWNVSGTYMQALPRFFSAEADGTGEREFLEDFFPDRAELLSKTFLKGYQWPFDAEKVSGGSSVIDLLVHRETSAGRRVFLDFRTNPGNREIDFSTLDGEAREYLQKAGADFGAPIDRLICMNGPAADFYRERGVNLAKEPLEIALCAQHCNGGLAVDCWWQTDLEGFFAVGEAAGTHGVRRPGGSALNAGQVGALRAAQYIALRRGGEPMDRVEEKDAEETVKIGEKILSGVSNVKEIADRLKAEMSRSAGPIRDPERLSGLLAETQEYLDRFTEKVLIKSRQERKSAFRLYDMLVCRKVVLSAMLRYAESREGSRGSALYPCRDGDTLPKGLPESYRFSLSRGEGKLEEVQYRGGECLFSERDPRPIPEGDDFFENVWREYRENKNVY